MGTKQTVDRIVEIGGAARKAFIDREDAITAYQLALVSGTHLIILGKPGTGKSRMIRYFAEAMGIGFFRKPLNPDIPREDLVGPIDPVALQQGIWDRAWTGLATEPVVFIDEIGKGSAQVQNMLLDAMEERKASCGSNDRDIPLHSLVSASNETIAETSPALWNRFGLRVVVDLITNPVDFERFMGSMWSADKAPSFPITLDELVELREHVYEVAQRANTDNPAFGRALVQIFSEFSSHGSVFPSPRQWKQVVHLAAAHAVLNGRDKVAVTDLRVAKMMLWDDVSEISAVAAFIEDKVGQEDRELTASTAALEAMEQAVEQTSPDDLSVLGQQLFRAQRLQEQVGVKLAEMGGSSPLWEALLDRANALVIEIEGKAEADPIF